MIKMVLPVFTGLITANFLKRFFAGEDVSQPKPKTTVSPNLVSPPNSGFAGIGSEWLVSLLEKRNPSNKSDMGKYSDRIVSEWVIDHIVNSEGYREKAYAATATERAKGQYTIGCGTSYLFTASGKPFVTNYPKKGGNGVRSTDTLTALKSVMGYGSLTSKQFAVQLVRNYLMGDGVSSFQFMKILDGVKVPFYQSVKDTVLEWAYGSGKFHLIVPSKAEYTSFIKALNSGNLNLIAQTYAILRYLYYRNNTVKGQWSSSKISWMVRVYVCAMYIKGVKVSNGYSALGYISKNPLKTYENFKKVFKRDLGIDISMV